MKNFRKPLKATNNTFFGMAGIVTHCQEIPTIFQKHPQPDIEHISEMLLTSYISCLLILFMVDAISIIFNTSSLFVFYSIMSSPLSRGVVLSRIYHYFVNVRIVMNFLSNWIHFNWKDLCGNFSQLPTKKLLRGC